MSGAVLLPIAVDIAGCRADGGGRGGPDCTLYAVQGLSESIVVEQYCSLKEYTDFGVTVGSKRQHCG